MSIVRLSSGGTVSVQTGVMKGVGPIGPQGIQGPIGPSGPPGPVGPVGEVYDAYASFTGSTTVNTNSAAWNSLVWHTQVDVDGTTVTQDGSKEGFTVDTTGLYVISAYVNFIESTTFDGLRSIGVFDTRYVDRSDLAAESRHMIAAADSQSSNGDTATQVVLTLPVKLTAGKYYYVLATSNAASGSSVPVKERKLTVLRVGVGRKGDKGDQGPKGDIGPDGGPGPQGGSTAGFNTINQIDVTGNDTEQRPVSQATDNLMFASLTDAQIGALRATNTTGMAYQVPIKTARPHIPYIFRKFLASIADKLIGKVGSRAEYDARSYKSAGDVFYQDDNGGLYATDNEGGELRALPLARVVVSSTPPSEGSKFPPGTIWLRY